MDDVERAVIDAARELLQGIDRVLAALAPFGRRPKVGNPVERELTDLTQQLRESLRRLDEPDRA